MKTRFNSFHSSDITDLTRCINWPSIGFGKEEKRNDERVEVAPCLTVPYAGLLCVLVVGMVLDKQSAIIIKETTTRQRRYLQLNPRKNIATENRTDYHVPTVRYTLTVHFVQEIFTLFTIKLSTGSHI